MQKTLTISLAIVMAYAVGIVLAISVATMQASADDGGDHKDDKAASRDEKKDNNDGEYTYKAQAGDSYSAMARKAVQSYGIDNKVNLSGAQIVFAETILTNEAKAGELNIGQEVKISKQAVKKQVEAAQKLTEAQQKAWGYYVQFVDFNTDSVGQA